MNRIKRKFWISGGALVIAAIFVVLATVLYSQHIRDILEKETLVYTQVLTEQSVKLISERLDNDKLYLDGLAESIGSFGSEINNETILDILDDRIKSTRFTRLAVIDQDGNLYRKGVGSAVNVSESDYFQKAMRGEVAVDTSIEAVDGSRSIITAVPIFREEQIIGAVIGWYDMEEVEALMSLKYFDKSGCTFIVDDGGEILAKSADALFTGNFADAIAKNQETSVTEEQAHSMVADMKNGEMGHILYTEREQEYHLNYVPTGINNWYFIVLLPSTVIDSKVHEIIRATIIYCGLMLFVFGGFALTAIVSRNIHHKYVEKAYNNIRSIYRTVPNAIIQFRLDEKWTILNANDAFYQLLNCPVKENKTAVENGLKTVVDENAYPWFENLKPGLLSHEFMLKCFDGTEKWIYGNMEVLGEDRNLVVQGAFVDITKQKEKLDEAEQIARKDSLTNLKNMRALEYELETVFEESGYQGAYMILDLDNFKNVNDTFGHPEGDAILKLFADCMTDVFRSDDFIVRTGGDEFLVYMKKVEQRRTVEEKGMRLMALLDQKVSQELKDCGLSVSIGVAMCPKDGKSQHELYQKADLALYEAKSIGKNRICFYE